MNTVEVPITLSLQSPLNPSLGTCTWLHGYRRAMGKFLKRAGSLQAALCCPGRGWQAAGPSGEASAPNPAAGLP